MKKIEFFYDVSSPYSYLASQRIDQVAEGVEVEWRPFLLGGVFVGSDNKMPGANAAKALYMLNDLNRCAAEWFIPFHFSPHFPSNSLLVMRILNAVEGEQRRALSETFFEACWVNGQNIADHDVVRGLLGEQDQALISRALAQPNKDRLRAVTDEAVKRGAFGAPTLFVGREMFFGNDRIEQAVATAKRA